MTKKAKLRVFDRVVTGMGALNVFATLPQALLIWQTQDATGVSTLSWAYYSVFTTALLTYGIIHKEIPIIVTYLGSLILYISILVGSIIY